MLKFTTGVLFSSALLAQTLAPPQSLTVVTATNKQVQLKWTAGDNVATGYAVQRKVLGSDDSTYATVAATGSGTAVSATDSSIDAYTAYVYRVLGTLPVNQSQSDPSNTVTVGPPPYGYNTVVAWPHGMDSYYAGHFGNSVRMVLDTSGDPALAYLFTDPDLSNSFRDELYFVRWDRAHYQWTAPVKIGVVGDVQTGDGVPVSLAQDAGSGTFGIAFEDESNPDYAQIGIALSSDGGRTWQRQSAANDANQSQQFGYLRPSLALGGGNVYLSFYHDYDGIRYLTGKATDPASKWASSLIPAPAGYGRGVRIYSSLALDSAGRPGVAFIASGDDSEGEFFWRPGGTPVLVADNNGFQNDSADLRLVFAGTQPRVAFAGGLNDAFYSDFDHSLWMMSSPDNGATWSVPANIPSDLGTTLSGPVTLAIGSAGQAAVATEENGGNGSHNCIDPKLAESSDLIGWTTCGLNTADGTISSSAASPQVAFAANDTLFLAFQQTDDSDQALPLGVILWRQPAAWTFPPPPPPQN